MFMTIKNVDVSGDLVLKRDETYSVMRPRLENIQMRMGLIRRHFSFDFFNQVRGVAEMNGLLNSVFWSVIGKNCETGITVANRNTKLRFGCADDV